MIPNFPHDHSKSHRSRGDVFTWGHCQSGHRWQSSLKGPQLPLRTRHKVRMTGSRWQGPGRWRSFTWLADCRGREAWASQQPSAQPVSVCSSRLTPSPIPVWCLPPPLPPGPCVYFSLPPHCRSPLTGVSPLWCAAQPQLTHFSTLDYENKTHLLEDFPGWECWGGCKVITNLHTGLVGVERQPGCEVSCGCAGSVVMHSAE